MSINDEFVKFINKNLALTKRDIQESVKTREWIINRVISTIEKQDKQPQLYCENNKKYISFGSYFKGTKVSNVDEFDILLIIDTNNGQFVKGNIKDGNGIGTADPNYLYSSKFYKSGETNVSSRKLLNWLKDMVDEALSPWGCESSERDGQAVTAYIKNTDVHIDFVPGCIFQKVGYYGQDGFFYIIPKGDINCGWIETNPRIDKEIIANLSKKNIQFKNTIRLFKYLFKESYPIRLSSYAIESAIVAYTKENIFFDDYEFDFIGIIDFLERLIEEENIPDMRDKSINLIGEINKDSSLKTLNTIRDKFNNLDENLFTFSKDVEAFLKNE